MSNPGPWASPRLRGAWARQDWAAIFKEYRRAAGISQRELEALTGCAQPYISLIEGGKRKPTSAEVIQRITQGLQVPEELGGAPAHQLDESSTSTWQPPPELRDRLAHARATGRADLGVAEWIKTALAHHRKAEDAVGGREMWPIVRSQLETVTNLIPDASGAAADQLLILAAEHAHWLSWVAAQEDQHGPALAWLDLANGWAVEAGSADLTSWVTRVRSHYALRRQDPIRALRTAEIARQATTGLSPAAEAIATHAEGMAAAAVGERDRARTLSDLAFRLVLEVPDEEDRPGWLYWLDPVRAKLQRADMAYSVRDWSDAASLYAESLDQLQGYPRDHAYYSARHADARSRI